MSGAGTLAVLALSTLASEDAACIAAGALIARGALEPGAAVTACWAGIVAGDILLFLAGRWIAGGLREGGRLARVLRSAAGTRAGERLRRCAPLVLVGARFVPGARLPSYLAAGAIGAGFPVFALWVSIGAALSTPLLVGASVLAASGVDPGPGSGGLPLAAALVASAAIVAALRILPRLVTYRGRRLLVSSWRRLTRWEFWPPWIFYLPVAAGIARWALRHRSLTLFTAANPAIPTGGLVGESKSSILEALSASGAPGAPFVRIAAEASAAERVEAGRAFVSGAGGGFPLVVKPDVGQRGEGVRVLRGMADLEARLTGSRSDSILQTWVPGPEFGVFYVRRPGEERGRIFSITRKVLPELVGDGTRDLARLILDDDRAVCMARFHLERFAGRLEEIPAHGSRIPLTEIGNHCRGAVFLDGNDLLTPALERRIDEISRGYEGFFFGRYDLKAPSVEHFRQGRDLTILELNGVGSESTDIYDPSSGLIAAWRKLIEQWRLAFDVGAANRALGAPPASVADLLRARARS